MFPEDRSVQINQFNLSFAMVAFFCLSASAFAESQLKGEAARKIYDALTIGVDTEPVNPGFLGKSKTRREVGGVSCVKSVVVSPGAEPSYECFFDDELNGEAVYRALNTERVGLTRIGSHLVTKTAGPLNCTKSTPVVPNPKSHYSCAVTAEAEE